MTDKAYSSKDFGLTQAEIQVTIPERLIHKRVKSGVTDKIFSDERKHPVYVVDLPSRALSMTIGGLEAGGNTGKHRHTYETILYVTKGRGYTVVEDRRIDWEVGDAVYIPKWAWHQHFNLSGDSSAEYLACENAPMLQNIGLAIREEEQKS